MNQVGNGPAIYRDSDLLAALDLAQDLTDTVAQFTLRYRFHVFIAVQMLRHDLLERTLLLFNRRP